MRLFRAFVTGLVSRVTALRLTTNLLWTPRPLSSSLYYTSPNAVAGPSNTSLSAQGVERVAVVNIEHLRGLLYNLKKRFIDVLATVRGYTERIDLVLEVFGGEFSAFEDTMNRPNYEPRFKVSDRSVAESL